jgi:hypothetical protein
MNAVKDAVKDAAGEESAVQQRSDRTIWIPHRLTRLRKSYHAMRVGMGWRWSRGPTKLASVKTPPVDAPSSTLACDPPLNNVLKPSASQRPTTTTPSIASSHLDCPFPTSTAHAPLTSRTSHVAHLLVTNFPCRFLTPTSRLHFGNLSRRTLQSARDCYPMLSPLTDHPLPLHARSLQNTPSLLCTRTTAQWPQITARLRVWNCQLTPCLD